MLHGEKVAAGFEIITKHTLTLGGHNIEFWMLNVVMPIETTGL